MMKDEDEEEEDGVVVATWIDCTMNWLEVEWKVNGIYTPICVCWYICTVYLIA